MSVGPLRGSRCVACAVTVYPADDTCPRCGAAAAPLTLSRLGELWSWTVQRFAPKSPPYVPPPGGFRPFAVGYVELPERVRVAAVLDVADFGSIRIGMPMRIEAGAGVPHAIPIAGERADGPAYELADGPADGIGKATTSVTGSGGDKRHETTHTEMYTERNGER